MSEEVKEHALEPFFTTKDVSEGSGLGLSMVFGFVSQIGGKIEIESAERAGSGVKLFVREISNWNRKRRLVGVSRFPWVPMKRYSLSKMTKDFEN